MKIEQSTLYIPEKYLRKAYTPSSRKLRGSNSTFENVRPDTTRWLDTTFSEIFKKVARYNLFSTAGYNRGEIPLGLWLSTIQRLENCKMDSNIFRRDAFLKKWIHGNKKFPKRSILNPKIFSSRS